MEEKVIAKLKPATEFEKRRYLREIPVAEETIKVILGVSYGHLKDEPKSALIAAVVADTCTFNHEVARQNFWNYFGMHLHRMAEEFNEALLKRRR